MKFILFIMLIIFIKNNNLYAQKIVYLGFKENKYYLFSLKDSVRYTFYYKNHFLRLKEPYFIFNLAIYISKKPEKRVKELFFCNKIHNRYPDYFNDEYYIWLIDDMDIGCANFFASYYVGLVDKNGKKINVERIRKKIIVKLKKICSIRHIKQTVDLNDM